MFRLIDSTIRHLFPGYFALAMATGILAIGAYLLGDTGLSWGLFAIDLIAYTILCLLNAARLVIHFDKVLHDLQSYHRGPGFLTSVAATCLVGGQFILLCRLPLAGLGFWFAGLTLWCVIIYAVFAAAIVSGKKLDVPHALHGGWLVPVVATESVAVLGALAGPSFPEGTSSILFVSLCLFLLGSMLYIVIITLIFRRLLFSPTAPGDLSPTYWIDVGAVAIATLAGSSLLLASDRWAFLRQMSPFLLGLTLLFWSTASWWIPLLITLEIWRHAIKRYPLRYDPLCWDIVFPLAMYAACTQHLARAAGLPLEPLAKGMFYLALAAWVVVAIGFTRRSIRYICRGDRGHRTSYHRGRTGAVVN